jgi:hypothetical protein
MESEIGAENDYILLRNSKREILTYQAHASARKAKNECIFSNISIFLSLVLFC